MNDTIIILAAVAAVAGFICWAIVRNRTTRFKKYAEELEKNHIKDLEAKSLSCDEALKTRDEVHRQMMEQQKDAYEKALEAKKQACDEALKAKDDANRQMMEQLQEKFDKTMKAMSAQLKNDTAEILKSRQEELQKSSSESLGQIVNPLKDNLKDLKKALEDGNKEIAERNGEMKERIKSLMDQTDATRRSADELAKALKHESKAQGDWGEMILTELLESQGLTEGRHFDVQSSICDGHGNTVRSDANRILRPDVILHLDNVREIIIDSKVSLKAYTDYINAEDERSRTEALDKHIRSLRNHIDELARKDYSNYIRPPKQSVGYVIMFVPVTGALWSALHKEKDLWRYAADKNVYMADEQSLYGALKIVNLTWTQIAQVQNQEKVYRLAEEMLNRVGAFLKYYNDIGKKLNDAKDAYDDGLKKIQDGGRSINTTAKQLVALGVKSSNSEIKALQD